MNRKTIAIVIILLTYFFPFRWAFLEYPENVKVNDNYVDAGRMEYMSYFLLVIAGVFVSFLLYSTAKDNKTLSMEAQRHDTASQKAVA